MSKKAELQAWDSIPDSDKALVIRTCAADMTAHSAFKWPESGMVECPDWKATAACGNGLHGLIDGFGDWSLTSNAIDAKWLLVEVVRAECVELNGKVKFPRGNVIFAGSMADAMTRMSNHQIKLLLSAAKATPSDDPKNVSDEDFSRLAASGYASRLAASGNASRLAASGYDSRLAASGYASRLAASGNDSSLAASGNASSLAASGNASRLAASGYDSRLAASGYASRLAASGNASRLAASGYASRLAASGNASRLAASGYDSRLAASGNDSRLAASGNASRLAASGNDSRLAASGAKSTVISAGRGSHASAAEGGAIALAWWDHNADRPRVSVAYVGENGIKPNVAYCLDGDGKFLEVR